MKFYLKAGAISGLLAVIIGAFGAHSLKPYLSPELLEAYKTGVQYQFYHCFALLIVAILYKFNESKFLNLAGIFFILGIFLFSGSLYVLAITGIKQFGIITPFGGLCFILGWLFLIIHSFKLKDSN